jgi:hypothetical protein
MQRYLAYRRYAEECRVMAEAMNDETYAKLLEIAAQWEQLAQQCERRYSIDDLR